MESMFANSRSVQELSNKDFRGATLIKTKEPSIVMFYANYCGYCHQAKKAYEEFADSCGYLQVYALDGVEYEQIRKAVMISGNFNLQYFPSWVFFYDGQAIKQFPSDEKKRTVAGFTAECMKFKEEMERKHGVRQGIAAISDAKEGQRNDFNDEGMRPL